MVRPRSPFRAVLAGAAAVLGAAALLAVPTSQRPADAAIGGITWQDEFNAPAGTPVSSAKWNFDIGGGGWGNNERQYYTNSTSNAVHDGQGNLVITARKENPANYQCHYGRCEYTSARLLTNGKFTQKYGRFETRLKVPRGQGIWPAFWMLGDDLGSVGWPASGEIDIMEHIGKEPNTVYGTVHGPGYSGGEGITKGRTLGVPLANDFHTYRVDWEPNLIVWYVDGVEYHRITPGGLGGDKWVFDHPFFMIMNVAVGGNWPGMPDGTSTYPQSMTVDYVRVSSYVPGTTPAPGGTRLKGVQSGRCIDIPAGNSADGTVRSLGKCMDPAWAGTANGTEIQIVACNGNPAQRFTLTPAGDLVNVSADRCVDVKDRNTANGARLILWDCNGQNNQKWTKA